MQDEIRNRVFPVSAKRPEFGTTEYWAWCQDVRSKTTRPKPEEEEAEGCAFDEVAQDFAHPLHNQLAR